MIIAMVDFSTAPTDRPTALAHFDRERDQVRAMPGNRAFHVHASREDGGHVTVIHEWDDEASLAAYLASDPFARLGQAVRPMMTSAPLSRRFHAEPLETVA